MKDSVTRILIALIGVPALIFAGFYASDYLSTPAHIRNPKFEHYHFRTQMVVYGEVLDFSKDRYQKQYDGDTCSDDLVQEPFHFHDNVDQMTHVHWDSMTGGEFIKYYGWNYLGGDDDTLGKRYDKGLLKPERVEIYGHVLPVLPEDAKFHIYIGDEDGYSKKSWQDFLEQDLEDFFGKKSIYDGREVGFNLGSLLFPKAGAHGSVNDEHYQGSSEGLSSEDLTRINNLIGSLVIFVQDQEPSDQEVKERFDNLLPLLNSTCGG